MPFEVVFIPRQNFLTLSTTTSHTEEQRLDFVMDLHGYEV
jgi:hypothetical protein